MHPIHCACATSTILLGSATTCSTPPSVNTVLGVWWAPCTHTARGRSVVVPKATPAAPAFRSSECVVHSMLPRRSAELRLKEGPAHPGVAGLAGRARAACPGPLLCFRGPFCTQTPWPGPPLLGMLLLSWRLVLALPLLWGSHLGWPCAFPKILLTWLIRLSGHTWGGGVRGCSGADSVRFGFSPCNPNDLPLPLFEGECGRRLQG